MSDIEQTKQRIADMQTKLVTKDQTSDRVSQQLEQGRPSVDTQGQISVDKNGHFTNAESFKTLCDMLGVSGINETPQNCQSIKAYNVKDFVMEEPSIREEGITITDNGIKFNRKLRPEVHQLSVEQWGYGSLGILLHMINKDEIKTPEVVQYIEHTQKTLRLFSRYARGSVTLYDKEYREAQCKDGFPWGSPRRDIQDFQLILKPNAGTLHLYQDSPNGRSPASKRQKGPFLPNGKEICRRFNIENCDRVSTNCKLAHNCSLCFSRDHPATKHPVNAESKK
ncbi:uncharacterized protein [Argopecten irradians]|uniref:uncharacterized protein n=1 Tax=Argopecten irradians TaxID=31199 RepID=UPI003720EDDF